jgi:hypothetical protein
MHPDYTDFISVTSMIVPARLLRRCSSFRHKARSDRILTTLGKSERDMGWTARIGLGVLVLLILGAAALAIYAGTLKPPHHTYEQVISNDRFSS